MIDWLDFTTIDYAPIIEALIWLLFVTLGSAGVIKGTTMSLKQLKELWVELEPILKWVWISMLGLPPKTWDIIKRAIDGFFNRALAVYNKTGLPTRKPKSLPEL